MAVVKRVAVNRAVVRWKRRGLARELVEQLRKANAETAHEADPLTGELPRPDTLEQDWRRDAQAEGFSPQQVEESWVWFHRYAFEPAPVLEETEQRTGRETMPDSVRRVLIRNPFYRFIGYDAELVDELAPIPDTLPSDADEQRFMEAVAYARRDPSNADARRALDRLGRLVKLPPERMQQLVEKDRATMTTTQKPPTKAETKRRLIQEAVVLSLAAAEQPIRIGGRKVPDDPGHPITLADVFGDDGLQEILQYVSNPESSDSRERLAASLGGPFRPAHLTDRAVYQNWLTKEIRRQTDKLLEQELDITDAGRLGGSRREEVPYVEAQWPEGMWHAAVGPDTRAVTGGPTPANGEPEDHERAFDRATNRHTRRTQAWEIKQRIEDALAARLDFERALERVRRESKKAAQQQRYTDLLLRDPALYDNNAAAARQLGWKRDKVRDIKREVRLKGKRLWKSQPLPKVFGASHKTTTSRQ